MKSDMFLRNLSLIPLLFSVASCATNAETVKKNPPLPYDNWTYVFVYPGDLSVITTYVRFLDTDGYLNRNPLPDLTVSDKQSVNSWRKDITRNSAIANKGIMPPQWMQFCWDSAVDRKLYQTTIEFSPRIWKMMRTPLPARIGDFYHNNMVIGLAPGGKVRVWFNTPGISGGENIQIAEGTTVSGKDLTVCKGKSYFHDGYPDFKEVDKATKGKKYPYGNW